MDNDSSTMANSMLSLTLELICLLIGEDCAVVRKSGGWSCGQDPIMEPPHRSLTAERRNKKVVEILYKMLELLTGEVPVRCQDVAVYLSMEEREYLDQHCELYKAAMTEDPPPLTSPDGSRKTNSPKPCPRPFYSQDSAHEERSTPSPSQAEEQIDIKLENVDEKGADMTSDEACEVRGARPLISADVSNQMDPPEGLPRPLYSQDSAHPQPFPSDNLPAADTEDMVEEVSLNGKEPCVTQSSPKVRTDGSRDSPESFPPPLYSQNSAHEEHSAPHHYQGVIYTDDEVMYVKGGEWSAKKETPPEMSTEGSVMRSPPERCPRPLYYSHYSNQEELNISQQYQEVIKVEDTDEEEAYDQLCAERTIGPGEQYVVSRSEVCPITTPVGEIVDDLTGFPGETSVTVNFHPIFNNGEPSADPATHGGYFPGLAQPVPNAAAPWMDLMAPCHELSDPSRRLQNAKKSFSCLNCGKSFKHKSKLETHERTHNGHRPYACSVCEKRFTQKAHLDTHNRIHTGEKPFVCLTCGRSFRDRSNLLTHQRTHTGLRPYSCLRCGKKFRRKMHQKVHICDHPAHHFK